MSLRVI